MTSIAEELRALKRNILVCERKLGRRLEDFRSRYNRLLESNASSSTPKSLTGKPLLPCSLAPLTGYRRDGYCTPSDRDDGKHLVCAELTDEFLAFTAERGNDLRLSAGDRWCLCESRYLEAKRAGKAPKLIKEATSIEANVE